MSWMIAELANVISLQDKKTEGFPYHKTLLPPPATKGKSDQVMQKRRGSQATIVRLLWIHKRELGPDDFHSDKVSPLTNHSEVPA